MCLQISWRRSGTLLVWHNDNVDSNVVLKLKRLDYCLRWLGTAVSFALFGIGGILQGILIHPLIWLLVRNAERRRDLSRQVVAGSMRLFIFIMRTLGVLVYEIQGREYIRSQEPCLILANHPSLIDVIFLFALFPEANCIVKAAMARNPLFSVLIRSSGYISNEDPVAMIVHATEALQRGESLIVFPEGTRTQTGGQLEFHSGAAAIALRTGCTCLPVFISCSPTTLTRQDKWYHVPDSRVRFIAAIQPPLDVSSLQGATRDKRAMTDRINVYMQDYFRRGLESGSG